MTTQITDAQLHEYLVNERGLTNAFDFGWTYATWYDKQTRGFKYPFFNSHGEIIAGVERFKAYKGKPKYAYFGDTAQAPPYYLLPGAVERIKETGEVYTVGGEIDNLTMHLIGLPNTLSWFGEKNFPAEICEHMEFLEVKRILNIMDCDATGREAAAKLLLHFQQQQSKIEILNFSIPDLGEKADPNLIFQEMIFDPELTRKIIFDLPIVAAAELTHDLIETPFMIEMPSVAAPKTGHDSGVPQAFVEAIKHALGVEQIKANGWSNNVLCPFHDDTEPSANWNEETQILYCHTCGTSFLRKEVAERLGIDFANYSESAHKRSQAPKLPFLQNEVSSIGIVEKMQNSTTLARTGSNLEQLEFQLVQWAVNDRELADQIQNGCEIEDFTGLLHQRIMTAVFALLDQSKPLDAFLIAETAQIDIALLEPYFHGGDNDMPDTVGPQCELLNEAGLKRRLQQFGLSLSQQAATTTYNAIELGITIERQLKNILDQQKSVNDLLSAQALSQKRLADYYNPAEKPARILSGLMPLDMKTGGFYKSHLIIIAGCAGMGKSALAQNFILNQSDKIVHIASLEMQDTDYSSRLEAQLAQINARKTFDQHGFTDDEERRYVAALEKLSTYRYTISERTAQSIALLRKQAVQAKRLYDGLDMIVVDYLQLMRESEIKHREQEIAFIAYGLKEIAKELNVVVIALAQLNRELFKRQNKRPTLADLRESGAIEQAADMVLFVHREGYFSAAVDPEAAEIVIAKNRFGELGIVPVRWLSDYTLFTGEIAEEVFRDYAAQFAGWDGDTSFPFLCPVCNRYKAVYNRVKHTLECQCGTYGFSQFPH